MPYELLIERHAEKDLTKLETSFRFAAKIKELADNPHPQGQQENKGVQK